LRQVGKTVTGDDFQRILVHERVASLFQITQIVQVGGIENGADIFKI
jgi:hypothetical protein